jgi:hypothetical protein
MEMRRKRENLRQGGRKTVKRRRLEREARTDKSFEQRVDEERRLDSVALPTTCSSALEPLSDPSTQIRLLRIQSSNQDGGLSLNLVVCERENAPPYKAISYTWGDDENPRPLSVNGRIFYVTANCYYALWQTQIHFPSCLVWIDSICIKQDDLREKELQVPRMDRIYGNASQVLACVGAHSNDSRRLARFSRTKSKTLGEEASHQGSGIKEASDHTLEPWWSRLPFWLRIWWMDISPSYFILYGSYGWAKYSMAIRIVKFLAVQGVAWVLQQLSPEYRYVSGLSIPFDALAQRSYWRRLWIVQELVKAREIVILCGEDAFPWNDILLLNKMLEGFAHLPESSSVFTFLEATINKKVLSTEELLVRVSKFGCRDPRDRLFGLLGLIRFSHGGSSETHNAFGVPGTFYGKYPINPPLVDYQVPAFEWVLQLANHIPFSLIPKLLQAFEVNASSIGMRNRAAQRRKRQFRQQKLDGPPLSEWSDDYWKSPYLETSFCRLVLDEKGFLTASLEKQKSRPVSTAASCRTTRFPDRPESLIIKKSGKVVDLDAEVKRHRRSWLMGRSRLSYAVLRSREIFFYSSKSQLEDKSL